MDSGEPECEPLDVVEDGERAEVAHRQVWSEFEAQEEEQT